MPWFTSITSIIGAVNSYAYGVGEAAVIGLASYVTPMIMGAESNQTEALESDDKDLREILQKLSYTIEKGQPRFGDLGTGLSDS